MLSIVNGIISVCFFIYFFPIGTLMFFFIDAIFNDSLSNFLFFTSISIYLLSFAGTVLLIILKIVNIEVKSNKIKKINRVLLFFFYVFLAFYIFCIAMTYFSMKYLH